MGAGGRRAVGRCSFSFLFPRSPYLLRPPLLTFLAVYNSFPFFALFCFILPSLLRAVFFPKTCENFAAAFVLFFSLWGKFVCVFRCFFFFATISGGCAAFSSAATDSPDSSYSSAFLPPARARQQTKNKKKHQKSGER